MTLAIVAIGTVFNLGKSYAKTTDCDDIFLAGIVGWIGTAVAQDTSGGWQATYWNNTDLSGDPVLHQLEADQFDNPELNRIWHNQRP